MRAALSLAVLALALAQAAIAAPSMPGRVFTRAEPPAASLRVDAAETAYRWNAPVAKAAADDGSGRWRVGAELPAPKDLAAPGWQAVAGGFVARFDVASPGAQGLRVRLALAQAGPLDLRVRGAGGRVESMAVAAGAGEAWGPWTEGDRQAVELFSATRPGPAAVRVASIVHFDTALDAKAAGECTIDVKCTTGDAALDAAIAARKTAMARISFVDGGRAFVCTGTLLDSERFPEPFFLTANHCIGRAEVASSITSLWFHEALACGTAQQNPDRVQVAGGMNLVFADPNTDQTLLVMKAPPPSGTTFSGWDAARLAEGGAVVSLSHPAGDVAKWALAAVSGMARVKEWEQPVWLTRFSRGIIQGGSSGSGLFTLAGGSLRLRAVLSATTVGPNGGLSCTNTGELGIYNRFDVFYPQVARYLQASPAPVADDHGNRPAEATAIAVGAAEDTVFGRIDYAGDVDVFRLDVGAAGTLVARSVSGTDLVGVLLDASGERLDSNDDAQFDTNDFGFTRVVAPGTYYLVVTRWESAGTGSYAVKVALAATTANYTDLWWNPAESGWGINLNHQGEKIFATLFTYEAGGGPLWLVLADGARQPDGAFQGTLYRVTGPVFNASPWTAATETAVGTMRLAFPSAERATLTYTYGGTTVTKEIQRQRFSPQRTACAWSAFDRSYATNFQDLWWNPTEPGWGINLAHQGDTIFATLFTYGADGRGTWFVMSDGARQAGTLNFTGTLYRTSGPAFDASPWAATTATPAGTMTLAFASGNRATLTYTLDGVTVTKSIQRQVFASPATQCEAVDED